MINSKVTYRHFNIRSGAHAETLCELFNSSGLSEGVLKERLLFINKVTDVMHSTSNIVDLRKSISSLDFGRAFGNMKTPILSILFDYRNLLVEKSVIVLDEFAQISFTEEGMERRLIPKIESYFYIDTIMASRIVELRLRSNGSSSLVTREMLEREIETLRFAKTHPCELIYVKELGRYVICIHTHNTTLPNGFSNIDEGSPISLDGEARQEYLVYVLVPDGVFTSESFSKMDRMFLCEQMKRSITSEETIKYYRPLVCYKNWTNQWVFSNSSNNVSVVKILNRLNKKETLFDDIDNILKKE